MHVDRRAIHAVTCAGSSLAGVGGDCIHYWPVPFCLKQCVGVRVGVRSIKQSCVLVAVARSACPEALLRR